MPDRPVHPFHPFRLDGEVGRGGMGCIYRGEHLRTGRPAALKVLTADRARAERFQRAFRREVQVLARLNHPNIATIYDYGRLQETDAPLPEEFRAGTPWYAMEYVDGESLDRVAGRLDWSLLEEILLSLLDALARSHAHEIIHRDLKPANVVLEGVDRGALRPVLVDFGVARRLEEPSETLTEQEQRVTGTPNYMAPEQVSGQFHQQGPWTDLYALGCMVWRLVCGEYLFSEESTREVLIKQVEAPPGPFRPKFSVPDGLEGWLYRLLRKKPRRRFRRAADAAWSLIRLSRAWEGPGADGEATKGMTTTARMTLGSLEDSKLTERRARQGPNGATTVLLEPEELVEGEAAEADRPAIARAVPPVPADWRTAADDEREETVRGAGLELFGLRTLPIVGRGEERERIWAMLRGANRARSARAMLIEGPAGTGKSRLAEWVARRAHELGVARILKATHAPRRERRDGLGGMLHRHFRIPAVEFSRAFELVRDALAEIDYPETRRLNDAVGFLDMMGFEPEGTEGSSTGFAGDRERHRALDMLLRRLAADRPVVLWLDDLPWGRRALKFAEYLFGGERPVDYPLFAVVTARREALEADGRTADRIGALVGEGLEIDPLGPSEQAELIRRMLDLEPLLRKRVVDCTEGNPLFAVQLLGDWVERGLLEEGADGFRLAAGAKGAIPANLEALWSRRIDGMIGSVPGVSREEGRSVLEIAATLGDRVDGGEWRSACRRVGLEVPTALVNALVDRGLVYPDRHGFSFVHGRLAESLRGRAREAGRWADHNALCAAILQERYPRRRVGREARRAEYLVEAGEVDRALEAYGWAIYRAGIHADYQRQERYIERHREILEDHDVPAVDRRHSRNELERARLTGHRGGVDEAVGSLEEVVERAGRHGWSKIRGLGLVYLALFAKENGEPEVGEPYAREAIDIFDRLEEDRLKARAIARYGMMLADQNRVDAAARQYERARKLAIAAGDRVHGLSCRVWGAIHRRYGRDDEMVASREEFRSILEEARNYGARMIEVRCLNQLGEIARWSGDFERARRRYRQVHDILVEQEGRNEVVIRMNMALCDVLAGRWQQGETQLERLKAELHEVGMKARLPRIYLGLAVAATGRGDRARRREVLAELLDFLEGEPAVNEEDFKLAKRGRAVAERRDDPPGVDAFDEVYDRLAELHEASRV